MPGLVAAPTTSRKHALAQRVAEESREDFAATSAAYLE